MLMALLALILILVLLGAGGLALHLLWYILIIAVVLWLLGFLFRGGTSSRWYYW